MFTKFLDVLPDPNYGISDAGESGAALGPAFASIKLSQSNTIESDRTISGKLLNKSNKYNKWLINIKYNPLTKAEFEPVFNFLLEKRGSLKPFYISLPQYSTAKSLLAPTVVTTTAQNNGGLSFIEVSAPEWSGNSYGSTGLPQAGDMFNISVALDTLHTKTYIVTHVETYDLYRTLPASGAIRIHFSPRLQKDTPSGSTLVFDNPLIRVTQKSDIQQYNLNTEDLYSFSLALEEAFY